jgi:cystathionine beta-synthase
MIGSVSESSLFLKVFSNPDLKTATIESVMDKPFPLVALDTPVEKLGTLMSKETGAVLAKDESGNYHIVTKYDVLQALT